MFFPISDDNPSNSSPLVTYFLIGLCLFVFFLQILSEMNPSIYYNFGFIPSNFFNSASFLEAFFPVITSMFVHGGFAHIIGNLLYLWIFGDNVEDSMGKLKFLFFISFVEPLELFFKESLIQIQIYPWWAQVEQLQEY